MGRTLALGSNAALTRPKQHADEKRRPAGAEPALRRRHCGANRVAGGWGRACGHPDVGGEGRARDPGPRPRSHPVPAGSSSPRSGEQKNRCDARADLEFAIGNVLVRHPLAREVEEQPEGSQTLPPACWLRNAGRRPRSSRAEDLEAYQRAANALGASGCHSGSHPAARNVSTASRYRSISMINEATAPPSPGLAGKVPASGEIGAICRR
jgi:hypothetical protein